MEIHKLKLEFLKGFLYRLIKGLFQKLEESKWPG